MGLGGRFDIVGFDPRGVDRSGGDRLRRRPRHRRAAVRRRHARRRRRGGGERRPADDVRRRLPAGLRRHAAPLLDREHGARHGHDPRRPRRRAALVHRRLLRHLPRRRVRHAVPRPGAGDGPRLGLRADRRQRVRPVGHPARRLRAGVRQLGGVVRGGHRVRLHRRRRRRPLGPPDRQPRGDPGASPTAAGRSTTW